MSTTAIAPAWPGVENEPGPTPHRICPECLPGAHDECLGSAWDGDADVPCACACWEIGHAA